VYGNGNIGVDGGGIWTNGCLKGDGSPKILVVNGDINYAGEFIPGNADWDPYPPDEPVDYQIPPSAYAIPTPNCTGRWVSESAIPRDGTPMTPGLYCFHGGLTINGSDTIIANGITWYVEGDITFNGNATTQISAPPPSPDPSPAIAGLLIYVPALPGQTCSDQVVKINGTSDSYFIGSIIAPCADITLNGTGGSNSYQAQVIGWDVSVGGTADLSINFDGYLLWQRPTYIELSR
jgi:hypothetical protein